MTGLPGLFAFIGWPEVIVILFLLGIPVGAGLVALVIGFFVNRSKQGRRNRPPPLPPPPKQPA
jgi:hypothetical protein